MLNNNFSKLVKLYKKYEQQQRNKMLLKLFAVVALVAGGWFLFTQATHPTPTLEHTAVTTAPAVIPKSDNATATKPVAVAKPVQKTVVETPKVEKMPKEVSRRTPVHKSTHRQQKAEENFQLKVTQRKSLYKLLVDYKDQKSYDAAIKIAQFYLAEKDYDKAVKWAIEASKKDPSQAESWIVYARAKKALGKPEVAKRALTIYLKHNYSQTAQNLLDSL